MAAPLPENEQERLRSLHEYGILDTHPEQAYDDIVKLASYICGTPIALMSLVDTDRQWFKASVGLSVQQTPREHAFCAHAILDPDKVMVVPNALQDDRFAGNPLVTGEPSIRFYAGAPMVTPTGQVLGTICAIDRVPHQQVVTEQVEAMRALSRGAVAQMELWRSIKAVERSILDRERYVQQMEDYQRRMEESYLQLEAQSTTDGLTGAKNRRAFERRLDEEVGRARRYQSPLALVLLDVDGFKAYNDGFGHPAGDEVLRTIVRILQENAREPDVIARYGGDEFALLLPETGSAGGWVLAERFRRAIQRTAWPHRVITASLGLANLTSDNETGAELIARADQALYRAKQSGRNRVLAAPDGRSG